MFGVSFGSDFGSVFTSSFGSGFGFDFDLCLARCGWVRDLAQFGRHFGEGM